MNTEDRGEWYEKGEKIERQFIDKYGDELSLIINPSKDKCKMAPDLYNLEKSEAGDLKYLGQPFYKAMDKFEIPPEYCWTLNVGDIVNYAVTRSDRFEIYIWQNFAQSKRYGVEIEPVERVWHCDLHLLKGIIGRSKIHEYIRRTNDTNGNAYASHTIDLRELRIVV